MDETTSGVVDDLDQALLAVLDLSRTTGVWRCWRVEIGPGDQATAARVYLVETTLPGDELARMADEGQRALAAAGHPALVEVYRPGLPLPAYQWTARSPSALIWAPTPAGEVRLADTAGAELPLSDEEMQPFATYLRSAPALTTELRTDGEWIWPARLADQVIEDGALTDADLLRHIRLREIEPRERDAVAVHRALVALTRTGGLS